MGTLDNTIVFIYLALMVAIGWYASRRAKGVDDYYVAGRRQGTFSSACLWLAGWIGGASIIGSSGRSYQMGITGIWYVTALALGCLLFGLFAAARVKRLGDQNNYLTYPDLIEHHYDPRTRIVATITTAAAYIAYSAGQMAAAGSILQVLLGWDFTTCLMLASAVVVVYTATGGYLAVAWTDWVQFILLIVGICLIGLPLAIQHTGSASELAARVPPEFLHFGTWGWPAIAALVVSISLSFFTAMDSYTRSFAAKNAQSARRGALLAVVFMLPIAVAAVWMGMSAYLLFPGIEQPDTVLTTFIVELFPAGLKGLMLVGVLAAVMSSADICILTASANVTRDVYQRFINPGIAPQRMLRMSSFASLGVGLLAMLLAWKMQSVLDILLLAFTLNSAALFLPTVVALAGRRVNSSAAFWSILLSFSTVILWYVAGALEWGSWFELDALWAGLLVSVLTFSVLGWRHRPALAAPA
ncbi:MAG TPA: sodium:solute symporter family protein [Xanthomonadales bacterium]|nr:sodium:solute symporter family protein [Xanthomonadales bacterium]